MKHIPIAVAEGDGIGPEIMKVTLKILEASGAPLDIQKVEIGEKVYLAGHKSGIEPKTWDILRRSKAFLKAPITTPQGGGFKSLNVTIGDFARPLCQCPGLRRLCSLRQNACHPGHGCRDREGK